MLRLWEDGGDGKVMSNKAGWAGENVGDLEDQKSSLSFDQLDAIKGVVP